MRGKRLEPLRNARQNRYTACETLNFLWDQPEIEEFESKWKEGFSIDDMATAFGRDVDEIAILAIDRCRLGRIQPRPGGVQGRRMPNASRKR